MNPYSQHTTSSPSSSFLTTLPSSLIKRPLAESGYYVAVDQPGLSYPQHTGYTEDQNYYRGGYAPSRVEYNSTLDNRPVYQNVKTIPSYGTTANSSVIYSSDRYQSAGYPNERFSAERYQAERYSSEAQPFSRTVANSRSTSIPSIGSRQEPVLRSDIYSKTYGTTTDSGLIYQKAEYDAKNVKTEPVPYRTSADHRANLLKLQAIIDAANARKAEAGLKEPPSQPVSSQYTSERGVQQVGGSNSGYESRSQQNQYKSVSYNDRYPELSSPVPDRLGQGNSYKVKEVKSESKADSLNFAKTAYGTGANVPNNPVSLSLGSKSTLVNNKDFSANKQIPISSARTEFIQPTLYSTVRQTESASKILQSANESKNESNKSQTDKNFSFRDSTSQDGRKDRLSETETFDNRKDFLPSSETFSTLSGQTLTASEVVSRYLAKVAAQQSATQPVTTQPYLLSNNSASTESSRANIQPIVTTTTITTASQHPTLSGTSLPKVNPYPLEPASQKVEQHIPYDISSLTSPPVKKRYLEDSSYGTTSVTSQSSASKKTFYTIDGSNALALKAFKNTVSDLSHQTPEKKPREEVEVHSPFEDLQQALNKENVQIHRIIIETVECPQNESTNEQKLNQYPKGQIEISQEIKIVQDQKPVSSTTPQPLAYKSEPEIVQEKKVVPDQKPVSSITPQPLKEPVNPQKELLLDQKHLNSFTPEPNKERSTPVFSEVNREQPAIKIPSANNIEQTIQKPLESSQEQKGPTPIETSKPEFVSKPEQPKPERVNPAPIEVKQAQTTATSLMTTLDQIISRSAGLRETYEPKTEKGLTVIAETDREQTVAKPRESLLEQEQRRSVEYNFKKIPRPIQPVSNEHSTPGIESDVVELDKETSFDPKVQPNINVMEGHKKMYDAGKADIANDSVPLDEDDAREIIYKDGSYIGSEQKENAFFEELEKGQLISDKESDQKVKENKENNQQFIDIHPRLLEALDSKNDFSNLLNKNIEPEVLNKQEEEEYSERKELLSVIGPIKSLGRGAIKKTEPEIEENINSLSDLSKNKKNYLMTPPEDDKEEQKVYQPPSNKNQNERPSYQFEQNVISQRATLDKKEQPMQAKKEEKKVTPVTKPASPIKDVKTEQVPKKSSGRAAKLVIVLLVILLLGLLAAELIMT